MGFILLIIAGICQGSFGVGYKNYKPFSWAAFWAVYCLMCIIIVCAAAVISVPASMFMNQYSALPFLCGAVWGLSAVCFSKAIREIGMSMVYGISMGISTVVGSVAPMLINNSVPSGWGMITFLIGLILTILGIFIITYAGIKRDAGVKSSLAGYIFAVISGLGSGVMNVGFNCSKDIGEMIINNGYSMFAEAAVKWLPVLVGGCVMGILWCVGELFVKHEWHTIKEKGSVTRSVKLFGVSIIWYAALLLYGLAVSELGSRFESVGWILFNALALIISVAWGLKSGEWKGHGKKLLFCGCCALIAAWIFIVM